MAHIAIVSYTSKNMIFVVVFAVSIDRGFPFWVSLEYEPCSLRLHISGPDFVKLPLRLIYHSGRSLQTRKLSELHLQNPRPPYCRAVGEESNQRRCEDNLNLTPNSWNMDVACFLLAFLISCGFGVGGRPCSTTAAEVEPSLRTNQP